MENETWIEIKIDKWDDKWDDKLEKDLLKIWMKGSRVKLRAIKVKSVRSCVFVWVCVALYRTVGSLPRVGAE